MSGGAARADGEAAAQLADVSRRALQSQWKSAVGGRAAWRLEDVLDWILLLEAVFRKENRRNWLEVAAELGVHERTLARYARRLVGVGLGEVRAQRAVLAARLAEQLTEGQVRP